MSRQLNIKRILFQTIQFCISKDFSSIWPIDRTLSAATSPGQSGPGNDDNNGVLRIPQSSSITRTSPLFRVISRTLFVGEVVSAEVQSVYFIAFKEFFTSVSRWFSPWSLSDSKSPGFLSVLWLILIIFTNPSARAGYDTRSIFNQSLTGLNSEFSFS